MYYGDFIPVAKSSVENIVNEKSWMKQQIIRDGKGIMLYKRGDRQNRIKYVGDFKENKFDGYGSIELYHGARYRGYWV